MLALLLTICLQSTSDVTRWVVKTWMDLRDSPTSQVPEFETYTTQLRGTMRAYDTLLLECETGGEYGSIDLRPYANAYVGLMNASPIDPTRRALLKTNGRAMKLFINVYDQAILDACINTDPPRQTDFMLTPGSIERISGSSITDRYLDTSPRQPTITSLWGADRWSTASRNRQPARGLEPGSVAVLAPGLYQDFRITRTFDCDPWPRDENGNLKLGLKNADKIQPSQITFGMDPMSYLVAEVPGTVIIQPNPVGGSSTHYLEWGGAITYEGIVFRGDDLAAFMTENMKQDHEWQEKRDVRLINCRIDGGWNAITGAMKYGQTKWGMLTYGLGLSSLNDAGFMWIRTQDVYEWDAEGIWDEHIAYHHNVRALTPDHVAMLIQGIRARWAGRTFFQLVNRLEEMSDAVQVPPGLPMRGQGRVIIRDCYVEDVCLQQGGGGSAITIAGNHDGVIEITDTTVMLGCNPELAIRTENITGALVVYSGGGADGQPTREVIVKGCKFHVGKVFKGEGSARRGNIQVSDCGTFRLIDTEVWNYEGTREAIDLELSTVERVILDDDCDVRGDILIEGFDPFRDTDEDADGLPDGNAWKAALEALKDHPKVEIVMTPATITERKVA